MAGRAQFPKGTEAIEREMGFAVSASRGRLRHR